MNPLRIGLLGHGNMGRAIAEEVAREPAGRRVVWALDRAAAAERLPAAFAEVDVVIEFTRPEAAVDNLLAALDAGVPIVTGTTGWLDRLPEIETRCRECDGAVFHAPNFSIGVQLFFRLNAWLANRMATLEAYAPALEETHHTGKRDAPSGTALRLAEDLLAAFSDGRGWTGLGAASGEGRPADPSARPAPLPLTSHRVPGVPGTHAIAWRSEMDSLEIRHTAHSRRGFAQGALTAAAWLPGRRGVFTMDDLLPDPPRA
jgi:4-hydroxy-tetrahydrodipicolinate reductase